MERHVLEARCFGEVYYANMIYCIYGWGGHFES